MASTDTDVAAAMAAAEAAQRAFIDLEHQALHADPAERPTASMVTAQREEAALAAQRVEITRQRAEAARAAARLAALEQVGADVDALAARPPSDDLAAAVRQVAEGAATIRKLADGHDSVVRDLWERAAALSPERSDPQAGPRPSSGRVALIGSIQADWVPHMQSAEIRHGHVGVGIIGGDADRAITAATGGDVDAALEAYCPVRDRRPPEPVAWWRDTVGQFGVMRQMHPQPDRSLASMIQEGRAVKMSPAEVADYEKGQQS